MIKVTRGTPIPLDEDEREAELLAHIEKLEAKELSQHHNLEKAKAFIKAECYCEEVAGMTCLNCDLLDELDV